MHRRFQRTAAARSPAAASIAAAVAVAAAPAAPAAMPAGAARSTTPTAPSAFVRVEGARATLLGQTLVRTKLGDSIKGHPCSETSAAGALTGATRGQWTGSYDRKFGDYLISSVLGETPTGNNFWTLFVNGRTSSTGACETPLHPGDHVLWFDCQADASFNCTNNPLALTAPAVAQRRHRITVHVTQIDGAGHGTPIGGAAVRGTGVSAVSTTSGSATLTPRTAGIVTLQARRAGATPSDPVLLCVYADHRSECGRAESGPVVHIAGITESKRFTRTDAPRELRGTAGPDPSGLTDVSFRLVRTTASGHCSYYDAGRATFRTTSCGKTAPSFSIGAAASWSYLLPHSLGTGRYRLEVIATDGANRRTKLVRGQSRIDFTVR